MMFIYPAFLWALLAVSIPIIIHLFNFRRYKKIYFTNVRFLKELQHESKSKSRLKELLILAARCLAVACLVLAFSQPILREKENGFVAGANAVSIYIDNSFSMDNVQKQGPLIDIAKLGAREVVKAHGGADKFQLMTNDFEGKHQRFYTKEDMLNKIDEVKVSSAVRLFSDVVKRQQEFLQSSSLAKKKIYAFSDAQKSTFVFSESKSDTSVKTVIVPITANQVSNIYIDSCWFESPLQQKGFIQKLHATIVNGGSTVVDAGTAKLFLNNQQLAIASYSVEPQSKTEVLFTFECKKSGHNFGSIKIEDYPVTFDDELFFAFNSKIDIPVCLLNGRELKGPNPFEALFKGDSLFKLFSFSETAIDYSKFKSVDVIVLNQLSEISSGLHSELTKFLRQGGSVLIVPYQKANLNAYNAFFTDVQLPVFTALDTFMVKTEKIETAGKFYSGVFEKMEDRLNLPIVNKHFKLLKTSRSDFENILVLQNGDVLLGKSKQQNGLLYLFTSPFDQTSSNFSKHALFVPTVYRICFSSLKAPLLYYEVNANNVLGIRNEASTAEQPPHIREIGNKADIIPEMRAIDNTLLLYTRSQINAPGFYEVLREKELLLPLAFNFSRRESDLTCYQIEEIKSLVAKRGLGNYSVLESASGDLGKQLFEETQGQKLWKLFIILALSFIVIEILLLRFLK
jgi:hypothetical protein